MNLQWLFLLALAAFTPGAAAQGGDDDDSKGNDTCYGDLGPFDNGSPWTTLTRHVPAPACRSEVNTTFFLYEGQISVELVTQPDVDLEHTTYNPEVQTIFITHGWNSGATGSSWVVTMARALTKLLGNKANVIAVDWSGGSGSALTYGSAVSNTRIAGAEISKFIKYLMSKYKVPLEKIYLIGFSLGCHVMAYAANGAGKVGRITGLDCAQPLFEGYSDKVYLDKSDACFVDAMHTSARPFIPLFGVGFIAPIGDVDFYVNGGFNQASCLTPDPPTKNTFKLSTIASIPVSVIDSLTFCSHGLAHEYFIASLSENCTMWGHRGSSFDAFIASLPLGKGTQAPKMSNKCTLKTISPMGLRTPKYPARGNFLVKTSLKPPYCILDKKTDQTMAKLMKKHGPKNPKLCG